MLKKETQTIKRNSQLGLWGSMAAVILTAAFLYSPWQFRQTPYVSRWMIIAGSILAVLTLSMTLLVIRRRIPLLRQSDDMQQKLTEYAAHIRSLYLSVSAVVIMLCLLTILSNQSVLMMLSIVLILMLFLSYPNIYKIKVDLGLSEEEMKATFGDKYIPENNGQD